MVRELGPLLLREGFSRAILLTYAAALCTRPVAFIPLWVGALAACCCELAVSRLLVGVWEELMCLACVWLCGYATVAVMCARVVCACACMATFWTAVGCGVATNDHRKSGALALSAVLAIIAATCTLQCIDALLGCCCLTCGACDPVCLYDGRAVFSVVLVLKLDGQLTWPWLTVFVPLWMALLLPGLPQVRHARAMRSRHPLHMPSMCTLWVREQRAALLRLTEKQRATASPALGMSPILDITALAAAAQTLLLGLWLDGHVDWSWQFVALPLW